MDLDKAFVAAVLCEGKSALKQVHEKGLLPEHLAGSGQTAWKFVLEYESQYGDVPDPEMVQGKTGVALGPPPPGPAAFFIDEVMNRNLHTHISKRLAEVAKFIEQKSPLEAFEAYEAGLRELRKERAVGGRTIKLPSIGPQFLDYYDRIKAGQTGILTPWPTINEATLGFWPEDFVLYAARLGVGKTFSLVLIMMHAWAVQHKRVLFATTEMSQIKIFQRAYAVHFRVPYDPLRKGRLDAFTEEHFRKGVRELQEADGLYIIGGDFDFKISSLEAAIEEAEPELVVMDGAYLLKVGGEGRFEKAANSYDELKRVAKRNHVPVVASTQLNREAKNDKESSITVDKIAMSDAAGWNADLVFALVQSEEMKNDRRMIQKPLKFREGEGEDIECNWDFEKMDFSELPKFKAGARSVEPSKPSLHLVKDSNGNSGGWPEDPPF